MRWKCKHPTTRRMWRIGESWCGWVAACRAGIDWDAFGARICNICGHWLPLGSSDETDERVAVEIRAAELATAWEPIGGVGHMITVAEALGWNGWPYRQPMNDGERVGFLAAQIRNHERDLGDVNWAGEHMADYDTTREAEWSNG